MKTKRLTQALERVDAWPAQAQDEFAEIARDIEDSLTKGDYAPTAAELPASTVACTTPTRPLRDRRTSRSGARQTPRRMKVVYTDAALRDLDDISIWLNAHYPGTGAAVERRLRLVVAHVARWPDSMRRSTHRNGVRIAPLGRYP